MVEVDVWADVRCPWCWIGARRLSRAVVTVGQPVRVRRRSFLLEPEGPVSPGRTTAHVATTEWGLSPAQWASKSQQIREEGLREGLDINVDGALMFDSRPVHRLLKLAAARAGVDADMAWEAAFEAHFGSSDDLGDPIALSALATGWGLSEVEVGRSLTGESYAAEVDRDVTVARGVPVNSVPMIVTAGGDRISGTSPVEDLVAFLSQAGAVQ